MRRLFEGGACSSNYCNWQLKSLLHLGQIVITFRTLLYLGSFITFRPSTDVSKNRQEVYKSEKWKILKKIHKVVLAQLLT